MNERMEMLLHLISIVIEVKTTSIEIASVGASESRSHLLKCGVSWFQLNLNNQRFCEQPDA